MRNGIISKGVRSQKLNVGCGGFGGGFHGYRVSFSGGSVVLSSAGGSSSIMGSCIVTLGVVAVTFVSMVYLPGARAMSVDIVIRMVFWELVVKVAGTYVILIPSLSGRMVDVIVQVAIPGPL